MKNIHILPTEHTSRLYYNSQERTYQLCEFPKYHTDIKSTHNLYITNSEEIKEGDWGLSKNNYLFHFLDKISICNYVKDFNYKKIILTTDDQLIKDGVQAIDDEFLEWFVNKANDSGKAIDIVEVEKEQYHTFVGMKKYHMIPNYKIIIPKEEPKQETLEEVAESYAEKWNDLENQFKLSSCFIAGAKWQQERSYSEEDMIEFSKFCQTDEFESRVVNKSLLELFEQFKNK